MANENLGVAKLAKNDEFYTLYEDIQKEMNAYIEYDQDVFKDKTILLPCDDPEWSNFTKFFAQNFETLGIKKLISTSYAIESKKYKGDWQPSLFEEENPKFDENKTRIKGKIFILDRDTNGDKRIDIEDLQWDYMQGDGDFRSEEVKKLRDEADFIITNPPFSLFREFMDWITKANKKFTVIGNKNCVTYKEIFPLIKENKMWLGASSWTKDMLFTSTLKIAVDANRLSATKVVDGEVYLRSPSVWYTNIEHGRRHQSQSYMTMAENIKYSKHKEIKNIGYLKYDNYDAIEVPFTDAIPSDYDGIMGVPISFLDKYCPEQFEIIGTDSPYYIDELGIKAMGAEWVKNYRKNGGTGHLTENMHSLCLYNKDGKAISVYKRILIRKK